MEVQGLSAAPSMGQLRGRFSLLLFGERSPSPVYPAPRQSRSGKELLQPAMVILDYKVAGDFLLVVLFSEQLTVSLIDEFCYR